MFKFHETGSVSFNISFPIAIFNAWKTKLREHVKYSTCPLSSDPLTLPSLGEECIILRAPL